MLKLDPLVLGLCHKLFSFQLLLWKWRWWLPLVHSSQCPDSQNQQLKHGWVAFKGFVSWQCFFTANLHYLCVCSCTLLYIVFNPLLFHIFWAVAPRLWCHHHWQDEKPSVTSSPYTMQSYESCDAGTAILCELSSSIHTCTLRLTLLPDETSRQLGEPPHWSDVNCRSLHYRNRSGWVDSATVGLLRDGSLGKLHSMGMLHNCHTFYNCVAFAHKLRSLSQCTAGSNVHLYFKGGCEGQSGGGAIMPHSIPFHSSAINHNVWGAK